MLSELLEMSKDGKSRRKRLGGAGRKPLDEDVEEALFSWIAEMRGRNLRVSCRMIMVKAKDLSAFDEFRASRGWLELFSKRKGLSLRHKTTVCQAVPSDCIQKLADFIIYLRRLQRSHEYEHDAIYAMDETACWMDMPSDTTIDLVGAQSVPLKTTGHEKDHYTVVLTARAYGKKMKPLIVFKGKGTHLMKQLAQITGVVVCFSSNGWMNDELTIEYLHKVLGQLTFTTKRLLIWDAYRCHTSAAVRAECDRMRVCVYIQQLFRVAVPNLFRLLMFHGMHVSKAT